LCDHFGLNTCDKPWLHIPQPVTLINNIKILWDFDIRTDHFISVHCPDIVVVDNNCHTGIPIDVAIPADANISLMKNTRRLINTRICTLNCRDFGT